MKGSEIFVKNYILNRWGETVVDKWNNVYETEVVFVDKLPKDEFYAGRNPKDYTGYRTMAPFGDTTRVAKFMSQERSSYNAGAAGYLGYVSTIYVLKGTKVVDIEKVFPVRTAPVEVKEEHNLRREEIMFYPPKKVDDIVATMSFYSDNDTSVEGTWYEVTVFVPGYVDNTTVRVFKTEDGIYYGNTSDALHKVWSRASSDIRSILFDIITHYKEENSMWKENIVPLNMHERKIFFDALIPEDSEGYVSLRDILTGYEYPETILSKVSQWLDENCDNGHFSRWTDFGVGLYNDAEHWTEELIHEWKALC